MLRALLVALLPVALAAPIAAAIPSPDPCFAVAVGSPGVIVEVGTGWSGVFLDNGWPTIEGETDCRFLCTTGTICADCRLRDACIL